MGNNFYNIIGFIICVFDLVAIIGVLSNIINIHKIKKQKDAPYYKLNLWKRIIEIEISLLFIFVSLVVFFFVNWGNYTLDIINILINISCSIVTSVVLSTIIYFKFLKHIPEETKKQIDTLLNDRLGHETTNHNAIIQKADSMQNSLSMEHREIREKIASTKENLSAFHSEFHTEKELKKLQLEYLRDNDKLLAESINRISLLGDSLAKVNYENHILKKENQELIQKVSELKDELLKHGEELHKYNSPELSI